MTNDKLARLPKWARDEIRELERQKELYRTTLLAMKENAITNVEVNCYNRETGPTWVPDHTAIRFRLGDFKSVTVRFNEKKDAVIVNTEASTTNIIPRASNSIEIKLED